ncbi:MAG TPA: ABC transporter permease, partial [Puia sp.]|nr:ABC transporter permease [Puia sp.]
MLFNYLKVGIRNILKYKVFSFINIFGLAAAMSVSMLIILMLADQKRYDQFNTKKDRIYRILSDKPDNRHPYATSPFPLSTALQADYPISDATTHLRMGVGGDATYDPGADRRDPRPSQAGSQPPRTAEMRGFFADNSFFKVFSFELEKGDRANALASPNSIVITSALARQLFGGEDPLGKIIAFADRGLNYFGGTEGNTLKSWGNYTITGVIADNNYKSHLKFDVLMSSSSLQLLAQENKIGDLGNDWSNYFICYTYTLLAPSRNSHDLDAALNNLVSRKYRGLKDFKGFRLSGQELTQITPGPLLGNEPMLGLPMVVYYFLSFLALAIMVSACLNYINLSTARALTRAKEIGIRKVTGAGRKDLVIQFLSESVLTALLAATVAVLILFFLRATMLHLWVNQYLNFELQGAMSVWLIFAGFALFIGLVAGIYPALYLSGFQPILALKNSDSAGVGKLSRRKVLSVFQFVISLFFIISSVLIFHQFRKVLGFKYEFNSGNIVNIDLQGNDYRLLYGEFNAVPGVSGVSGCQYIPVTGRTEGIGLRKANGVRSGTGSGHSNDAGAEYKDLTLLPVDEHFIGNMELKLLAGKNLPPAGASAERFVVVNAAAVNALGYQDPEEILGQSFREKWNDTVIVEVIGVVQDFHVRSAMEEEKIGPMVLQNRSSVFQYANVKIASGDLRVTMTKLEAQWKKIDPIHPFRYQFFNEQLATASQALFDIVSILGFIAFLAASIACLGLLGMATYTTERRKKEVGIRKVLGAKASGIIFLLSREFLKILLIAVSIAVPLSYIVNNLWLRKFPNRVEFGAGAILEGVLILLLPGLLVIGS